MRFMMVVSPAAAIGRACSGAPCLITYQSGPIRMEARLGEIRRERKGEAEADAQQKSFTCAHTSESIPQGARPCQRQAVRYDFAARQWGVVCSYEVMAPNGAACGSFDATIASGTCRTEDLGLTLDGTPVQLLPKNLSSPNTCSYRWWAHALR